MFYQQTGFQNSHNISYTRKNLDSVIIIELYWLQLIWLAIFLRFSTEMNQL